MEGKQWRGRRTSLVVMVVPILFSGSLAIYSNGRSRYQEFHGCNDTNAAQAAQPQEAPAQSGGYTGYQPVVVGPHDAHEVNRIETSTPSYSTPTIIGFGNNRFTLPGGGAAANSFYEEEEKPKPSYTSSILGTDRVAQFRQSVMAYRNQIMGNRFFDPDHSSVHFTLYTRANPQNGQKILIQNRDSLESSTFDPEKPTKLIIHGFSEIGSLGEWVGHLRDAYLTTSEANVIVADFSTFETFLLFWTNLPVFASKRIVDLITFLELAKGASRENFHLIARSFGTHVAGVTGRMLQGKLGRITGLEPEPRVYGTVLPDYRLTLADAQFVDIVHINGRRYFFHGARFGLAAPTGHVDIYPNYSERSGGCPGRTQANYGSSNFAFCQRGRGVSYFTESIKYPQNHPMCQCTGFSEYKNGNCFCSDSNSNFYLGEYLNNQTRGVFQLKIPFINRNVFRGLPLFG